MTTPRPDIAGLPSFAFGNSPDLAERIAALVVTGRKTLTGWPVEEGEKDVRTELIEVVLDGRGRPVFTIETTGLSRSRFDAVSPKQAAAYGEGDLSLEWWRWAMKAYYEDQNVFRKDMELYMQAFRLKDVIDPGFAQGAADHVDAELAEARKDGFNGDAAA